jgi:hypothetical protein
LSKPHPTPHVSAEVIGGRLVRVCPVCKQQISERTNEEGLVSNDFADHYEAEHREHEPERQRCYVLALQPRDDGDPRPRPQALRNVSHLVLDLVKEQMPDVDWHLVHDLHGIPERAPVLDAGQVLRGAWQREGDDPQLQQVRWYRREGDHLVFTPTEAQLEEWTGAREWTADVRAALLERQRDALPEFSGDGVAAWEEYYAARKRQEDEIAKAFDAQRDAATKQFYRGDYRWASTLEAAIDDLAIPEDEIKELRARTQARLAEAEASLRTE